MAFPPGFGWRRTVVTLGVLALPVATDAQVSPTAPAHPSLPWSGITTPQGQLIRYIYVPPQSVTLQYLVPGALASAPPAEEPTPSADGQPQDETKPPAGEIPRETPTAPQVVQQQVTVPGYYVRETTVGFHYPDRWTIEQAGPNVYRWRQLPAQFVPK